MVADLEIVGSTDRTGTTVHFTPDPEIFTETTEFDFAKLDKRVQELAFLNRGLHLSIIDKRDGLEQTKDYHYEGGIASYVEFLNENKDSIFETPIYIEITAQPKYLLYSTAQENIKPMIVPGFGKSSSKFNMGFSWNIAYAL